MFNVGPTELMVILVLALIVFGPKKLPEMGKSIGKGLKEFRKVQADIKREVRDGMSETPSDQVKPAAGAQAPGAAVSDGQGAAVSDGKGTAEQSTA